MCSYIIENNKLKMFSLMTTGGLGWFDTMLWVICKYFASHEPMKSTVYNDFVILVRVCVRASVWRPCVETKLTATKKSATDGNWSVTTLCQHKRAYDRIQLVADSCWQSRMFDFYDQLPINRNWFYQDTGDLSSLTTAINCISKVADQRQLSRRVDISWNYN